MTTEETPDTTSEQQELGDDSDHKTLWVSSGRNVYHVDPECTRLKSKLLTRRAEIAKAWYDPCSYCTTDGDGSEP